MDDVQSKTRIGNCSSAWDGFDGLFQTQILCSIRVFHCQPPQSLRFRLKDAQDSIAKFRIAASWATLSQIADVGFVRVADIWTPRNAATTTKVRYAGSNRSINGS